MAVTYDSSLVYCVEADVERYGVYDWDTSSSPDEDEVYEYAQDVAAAVETKTERAGNRIAPSAASSEPTRVARILEQANAVGAAMLARGHMYRKHPTEANERVWMSLARKYESLMGDGSSGGGEVAGVGDGGLVEDTISSEADTGLLANEVTEGEITLKTLSNRDNVAPEFTVEDID